VGNRGRTLAILACGDQSRRLINLQTASRAPYRIWGSEMFLGRAGVRAWVVQNTFQLQLFYLRGRQLRILVVESKGDMSQNRRHIVVW
jgi:hypothetical protein